MRPLMLVCALVACVAAASNVYGQTPAAAPTPALVVFPGSADPTFRVDGPPSDTFEPGRAIVFSDVLIQSDGKIVVGGAGLGGCVVVRYDVSGKIDQSFGDDGIASTQLPRGGGCSALAVTSQGHLVGAGKTGGAPDTQVVDGGDFAVVRYTSDGVLDPTFGGGIVITDIGEVDQPGAVLTRGDRIVLVGSTNGHEASPPESAPPHGAVVLIGYRVDGTLDPTFGDGGITRVSTDALDQVAVASAFQEPEGSIVVAATATNARTDCRTMRLLRFDRDGHAPKAFTVVPGFAVAAGPRSDGKVMVNGVVSGRGCNQIDESKIALVRFNANGDLDDAFGDGGILTVSGHDVPARAMAIDSQDRVVLAEYALSRRFADGALDPAFHVSLPNPTIGISYRAMALQVDGKIVAAGGGCVRGGPNGTACFYVVGRYEDDQTQFCGDADADGTFSVTDGVQVLRAAAGLTSMCNPTVCDVDGNRVVGVSDGVNVLRAAAQLPAALTCGVQ